MKKKVLVPMVIALAALSLWGISHFVRLPFLSVHPHEAIPSHTALFFGLKKNQIQAISNDEAPKVFTELFSPKIMREDLIAFQSLLGGQLVFPENEKTYVTVNPTLNFGIDLLFILPNSRGLELKNVLDKIEGARIRSSVFQNVEVFTVNQKGESFSFAKFRNLLLMARHAYLVENAIIQLKTPASSICRNEFFRRTKPSNDDLEKYETDLNISELGAQFAPLIEPSRMGQIKRSSTSAHFARVDFQAEKELDFFEIAVTPNLSNPILEANQSAAKFNLKEILSFIPDDLSGFVSLSQNGNWNSHFSDWAGQNITLALGEKIGTQPTEHFVLLEAKHPKKAEAALAKMTEKSENGEAFDVQIFTVFPLEAKQVSAAFGLDYFSEKTYGTVLGEYVLFGNSRAGIERWLMKYMAGQTFSKHPSFLESLTELENKNQAYFYFESRSAWQIASQFLSEKRGSFFRHNPFTFKHLVGAWNWDGKHIEARCFLQTNQKESGTQAGILWQTPILGDAVGRPFISQNPHSGEREILVKDDLQNLYLISNNGRIIWQRKFDAPILSEISEIDLKGDDRRQFVLNTPKAIFILDDDGSDMPGYPLQLQVPATNEVTIVDFFQSNDYHFFVACENGNAYGFDERGSPVEGWRPKKGIGEVEQPLLHFQAMGMDFLALLNLKGDLQVFQKNGKYRFPKVELEQPLLQKLDFQAHPKSSRIVTCDETGRVFVVNFQGNHFKLNLKVGKNEDVKFLFSDVVGDSRKDYLALSGDELAVYFYENSAFEKAWTHSFPMPQNEFFPVEISKGEKGKIGTVSTVKKRIFLLDENGKVEENFPLEGTTPFLVEDLLRNGKKVVVTGNGRRVCAYSI